MTIFAAPRRSPNAVGYLLVCGLTILYVLFLFFRWSHYVPGDFNDFYSGGRVVGVDHSDPYLVQPLLRNELAHAAKGAVIAGPVPLPPYDLFFLGAASKLGIHAALVLMALTLLGATYASSFAVGRLAHLPLTVSLAAVAVGTLYESATLGQIAPIAIAGIAFSAWAVQEKRFRLASLALLIGAIEPHMAALPIIVALLYLPRMRVPLFVGIVVLSALGFVALGDAGWPEYFRTLQLQILAEINFPAQYSLTWLLHALGFSTDLAVLAGSFSTAFSLLLSILVVRFRRDSMTASAAVILIPATLALIGGSFVHVQQITFVLIPALIFIRPTVNLVDSSWLPALFTLPFGFLYNNFANWPTTASWFTIGIDVVVTWTVVFCINRKLVDAPFAVRKASVITTSCGFVLVVLIQLHHTIRYLPRVSRSMSFPGTENASIPWKIICDDIAHSYQHVPYLILVKSVIWSAIVITAILAIRSVDRLSVDPSFPIGERSTL